MRKGLLGCRKARISLARRLVLREDPLITFDQLEAVAQALEPGSAGAQEAAQSFPLEYVLAIIGVVIGVIGAAASLISWQMSRRSRRQYDYLLRLASLNIDKEATEEQIAVMRQQASRLDNELADLRHQIQRDIPVEARRAVLRDRMDAAVSLAAHSYNDLVQTKQELDALGLPKELPAHLLRAIESAIEPRYLRRERISNRKTLLTIISGSAAVASTLLPFPFGRYIGALLILLSVPIIMSIARLTLDRSALRLWLRTVILGGMAAVLLPLAGLLAVSAYNVPYFGGDREMRLLASFVCGVVGAVAATCAFVSFRRTSSRNAGVNNAEPEGHVRSGVDTAPEGEPLRGPSGVSDDGAR